MKGPRPLTVCAGISMMLLLLLLSSYYFSYMIMWARPGRPPDPFTCRQYRLFLNKGYVDIGMQGTFNDGPASIPPPRWLGLHLRARCWPIARADSPSMYLWSIGYDPLRQDNTGKSPP